MNDLADDIERDFLNDGVVKSEYEKSGTYDYLNDATKDQRVIILKGIKKLITALRQCAEGRGHLNGISPVIMARIPI